MTFPAWWPYPTPSRKARKRYGVNPAKRARVYERDGYRCVECGTTRRLTLDHRIPRSQGGTSDEENLQTMCRDCNERKGDGS